MEMKFKILIENTTEENLICEHGLSIYIEFDNKKILLDAGQSGDFISNSDNMGVALEELDFCVLSHGHYDHSGGFEAFFDKYKEINIYAMKDVIKEYYSGSGGNIHYIGLSKEMYSKNKDRFNLLDGYTRLCDGVYAIPHNTKGLDKIGERCKLYKRYVDTYVGDDFLHELSLVFDTPKGIVIFNSCSHGGVKNIVDEVMDKFKDKKLYAFIGGLHMKGMQDGAEICIYSDDEVRGLCEYMMENDIAKLYTGHCTGNKAYEKIKIIMKDKVEYISTGKIITI